MLSGSAKHALRVLEIAPHFIDMHCPNIFIFTANASAYALVDMLKDETLWRSDNPESSFKAAIANHHAQMPTFQTQKERLRELIDKRQDATSTPEATRVALKELQTQLDIVERKTLPIGDYEWAVACKLVMQQTKILNDTAKVKEALKSLIENIQTIQAVTGSDIFKKGAAFLRIEGQHFQDLFLNFMGKLCLANEFESAHAIHEYFHLGQLALTHSDVNELDSTKIGMTLAPGLFQSLGVFGQVLPRTGDEAQDVSADAREYACFKLIMKELVMIPEFAKDFNPELYLHYLRPEDLPKSAASAASSSPATSSASSSSSSPSTSVSPSHLADRLRRLDLSEGGTFRRDRKDSLPPKSPRVLPGYSMLSTVTRGGSPSGDPRTDAPSEKEPPSHKRDPKKA